MHDTVIGIKKPLKEKIILIYDEIFQGNDPTVNNPNFWDELFLLSPHPESLERIFRGFSGQKLLVVKPAVNTLFYRCVLQLQEQPSIRTVNAIQTLCGIIQGVVSRSAPGFGFDMIDLLIGFDRAEPMMKAVLERTCDFLVGDFPSSLKVFSLKLLLRLASVSDNVSQNTLLEYMMINSVFETIIAVLGSASLRQLYGHDSALLLTLLINYRKYENVNPYIVKLSILDDELALNGYSQVIAVNLSHYNRVIQANIDAAEPRGILSSLTNMVGNMFVPNESTLQSLKSDESVLLAMYEAVHLNRNFITTLTNLPADASGSKDVAPDKKAKGSSGSTDTTGTGGGGGDVAEYPTNLLVAFLTYCSVITQDLKKEGNQNAAKLCMIILTCIAEDQYANTLMHDINVAFRVPLYRAPMRHRRAGFDKHLQSQSLACAVLELCNEFIRSHMMRSLPFELYLLCLGVVHRILCYEKKCRVRLKYAWRDLVNGLCILLKFLITQESVLIPKYDIFLLSQRVVNIINVFITFGDSFLPSPAIYDEIYYEIIRNSEILENLYTMALRYTSSDGDHKASALKLCNHLVNIRAIINHFGPKIEAQANTAGVMSLTEQQVLAIVRDNYDSLSLKLQENLDVYERYNEQPKETAFFIQMVRRIIQETRHHLKHMTVDSSIIHKEFSLIKTTE